MTRLSVEIDERILNAIDHAAADVQASREEMVKQAIELGIERIRAKRLEEQHRQGYARFPIQPGEFDTDPEDLAWPGEEWK